MRTIRFIFIFLEDELEVAFRRFLCPSVEFETMRESFNESSRPSLETSRPGGLFGD